MTNGNGTTSLPLKISGWFGGTTRFYIFVFVTVAMILAFLGKLSAEYVAFASTILGVTVAHSAKEDYHERAMNGNGHSETEQHS